MNIQTLDAAIKEAERFIEVAKACKAAKKKRHEQYKAWSDHSTVDNTYCPKEQGAARRASLDLSRALSEFRKTN